MFIIGITGGSGAGKSTAVNALIKLGAKTLDCDEIYHDLLLNCDEMIIEIKTRFYDVMTDGIIDRKKLGEIVWREPDALLDLNTITHKYISSEIDRRLNAFREQGAHTAAIDAIALIESGQNKKCDNVVGVITPVEKRISRIMERDGITKEQAEMRINAQKPDSFYRLNCDFCLENSYDSPEEFEKECSDYFKTFLSGDTP